MTKISNYEVVADNIEELTSYVNDHNKFTNIMRNDLSWFTDLGFISCELYSDDDYSRNYYKVIGNEILMLHLRTQDIKEGKFGIRKKIRLFNNEKVLRCLNSPKPFDNLLYGKDNHHYIVSSDDINYPSIVSYLTIRIENSYYQPNGTNKKIVTYINIDKIEFSKEDSSDFYLSNAIFINRKLDTFKIVTDGIERDITLLLEFVEYKPTVFNFFNYDNQLNNDTKFILSALAI